MTKHFRFRCAALALVCVLSALTGCSKKVTQTDADYTQLEGVPSAAARMMVWLDSPTRIFTLSDGGTPGTTGDLDDDDFVIATEDHYVTGPGAVQTSLLDATQATGFEIFRLEGNGGFRQVRDFVINPERKWRDSLTTSSWEMYRVDDSNPSGYSPASYMARGLLGGVRTTQSPLSNLAQVTSASLENIRLIGSVTPTDSLFRVTWTPVTGATGYWLQVFQFRGDASLEDKFDAASPSPVVGGKVTDFLVAYLPQPTTTYRLGEGAPAEVVTRRQTIYGQLYNVRVTAVDAAGQLIGFTRGDTAIVTGDETYRKYAQGSFIVTPTRRQN